ncbi:MAG: hypothetical protein ACYDA2_00820 [Acidimicrobiales bacterium]
MATPEDIEAASGADHSGAPLSASWASTANPVVDGAKTTSLVVVTAAYVGRAVGACHFTSPVAASTACNEATRIGSQCVMSTR